MRLIRKFVENAACFRASQRVADGVIIVGALLLISVVMGHSIQQHQVVAGLLAGAMFIVFAEIGGLYRPFREEGLAGRIGRIWSTWAITFGVLLAIAFMLKETDTFSRIAIMSWFVAAPMMVAAWHTSVGLLLRLIRARGHNLRKAVFVGINDKTIKLAASIKDKPWLGIEVIGHFEDRGGKRRVDGDERIGPFLGNYEELEAMTIRGEIDVVYISLPLRAEARINQLIDKLGRTTASVYITHSFSGFNLLPKHTAPRWSQMGDISVLGIVESPYKGAMGAVKQFEDMILGTFFLLLCALPMLAIAIAIKASSKGPVFFKQTRYGLNGEKIDVLKFRTMTVMENGTEVKQATKDDARITRVGAFLRRTSLDELPQFIHVVTGKMSLVGPRPHAVAHNEQYRKLIEHYMVRHKVKPGITGWAQVNGWRGETDTDEKMQKRVEYDLRYIRDWSPLLDLKIIFMTVFGRKTHHNAY